MYSTDKILSSPATSFWLKNALESALKRDPLDAYYDTELLLQVLADRKNIALKGPK